LDTTDDISQEEINHFLKPPFSELSSIKGWRKNDRVSLEGIVQQVFQYFKF
jgi:hypothetical protein